MSIITGAVGTIQAATAALMKSNFTDTSLLERLGIHREDKHAIYTLHSISQSIARGDLKPLYSPETQQITFFSHESDRRKVVAVFKPGLARARDESFARRMSIEMGVAHAFVPAMISSFDFSSLSCKVRAGELSQDAFDTGAETALEDIFFAQESHPNGVRTLYLPEIPSLEDLTTESELKLQGVIGGILEPFLKDVEVTSKSILPYIETVLVAAILGGRDLKSDAFIGDTIIDGEEIMGRDGFVKAGRISPSLHLPLLGKDPRALTELSSGEIIQIKKMVDDWSVEKLVGYLSEQRMDYRQFELERVEEGVDESVVRYLKERNVSYLSEQSCREEEFFPLIDKSQETLFHSDQMTAFEARLQRLKEAFAEIDPIKLPEMNLWGLVHIIDPANQTYSLELCRARAADLQGQGHNFGYLRRSFFLDSGSSSAFVSALGANLGRVRVVPKARSISLPADDLIDPLVGELAKKCSLAFNRGGSFYFNPEKMVDQEMSDCRK